MYILENDLLSTQLQQSVIFSPLKFAIIKSFWGPNITSRTAINNELQLEPYFSYYSKQCHLMLGDGGRHISARRHHDISHIVELFNEEKTLEETVDAIRSNILHLNLPDEEDMILGSINLAARLYLMMSFGEVPNARTPERALSWTGASIQDFLKQHLEPRQVLASTSVKLQKIFNARNIQRLAGIKIEWTSDLGQHLRMIHDDERVAIFHNASFLRLHQQRYVTSNSNRFRFESPKNINTRCSRIFPEGFIDETLRTLALLFPQSDKEVKKWVQGLPSEIDQSVRICGSLGADSRHIERFSYWHDRVVVLKQVFDEVEPGTVAHLWNDRRRPVQWYTLWTAVLVILLTIFFGFVQCIEGAFQVYKAYYPK